MNLSATGLHYQELNEAIRAVPGDVVVENVVGQRYIGCGQSGRYITLHGTPGNALGAYLNGAAIKVCGNAQDAVGDTMNDGFIVIEGSAGDALGYAMRGGKIYVRGNSGYRTGIHMKEYEDKSPVIVVGGKTGSFLGEYLAGGLIIVLGLWSEGCPVSNFTGMGMHGGRIFIRSSVRPQNLPPQVVCEEASAEELASIEDQLIQYAALFHIPMAEIHAKPFYLLHPNAANPYKRLYTTN